MLRITLPCFLTIVFAVSSIFMINTAISVDLGIHAQTFVIKEEGFSKMMKRRASEIDIEKEQEKMVKKATKSVKNPLPVSSVKPATEDREFLYEPVYVLREEMRLPNNQLIYPAGTKVNALKHMELHRRLIFIDARIEEQKEWLQEQLQVKNTEVEVDQQNDQLLEDRIILIGGSVFEVKELLSLPNKNNVYFDQKGELVTRFGIKASPAIAVQDGKYLRIKEYAVIDTKTSKEER